MKQSDVIGLDKAPERVKILVDGACLTSGVRNELYGDPSINLQCAAQLKTLFWAFAADKIQRDSAEAEGLDQVLTKLGRIATGGYSRENYMDGATYLAIAGEVSLRRPVDQASNGTPFSQVERSIDEPIAFASSQNYDPGLVAHFLLTELSPDERKAFDSYLGVVWNGDLMLAIPSWRGHRESWLQTYRVTMDRATTSSAVQNVAPPIPRDLDPSLSPEDRARAAAKAAGLSKPEEASLTKTRRQK